MPSLPSSKPSPGPPGDEPREEVGDEDAVPRRPRSRAGLPPTGDRRRSLPSSPCRSPRSCRRCEFATKKSFAVGVSAQPRGSVPTGISFVIAEAPPFGDHRDGAARGVRHQRLRGRASRRRSGSRPTGTSASFVSPGEPPFTLKTVTLCASLLTFQSSFSVGSRSIDVVRCAAVAARPERGASRRRAPGRRRAGGRAKRTGWIIARVSPRGDKGACRTPVSPRTAGSIAGGDKTPRFWLPDSRRGQLHVGALPGLLEALLRPARLGRLPLCCEGLLEPEERPAVLRVLREVLPVDRLSVRRALRLEEERAERLPGREVPGGRLHVVHPVLRGDRRLELRDRGREIAARGGDLARQVRAPTTRRRATGPSAQIVVSQAGSSAIVAKACASVSASAGRPSRANATPRA